MAQTFEANDENKNDTVAGKVPTKETFPEIVPLSGISFVLSSQALKINSEKIIEIIPILFFIIINMSYLI